MHFCTVNCFIPHQTESRQRWACNPWTGCSVTGESVAGQHSETVVGIGSIGIEMSSGKIKRRSFTRFSILSFHEVVCEGHEDYDYDHDGRNKDCSVIVIVVLGVGSCECDVVGYSVFTIIGDAAYGSGDIPCITAPTL